MFNIKKMWSCPMCKRQFVRRGQSHSCKVYLINKHFENKPGGKLLYAKFKAAVKEQIGPFKIESLECCIHFVNGYSFAAVKIFEDKIQVDFSLTHEIKSKRIDHFDHLSPNRYLYYVNIYKEDEIDKTLLQWIEKAYFIKSGKPNSLKEKTICR